MKDQDQDTGRSDHDREDEKPTEYERRTGEPETDQPQRIRSTFAATDRDQRRDRSDDKPRDADPPVRRRPQLGLRDRDNHERHEPEPSRSRTGSALREP